MVTPVLASGAVRFLGPAGQLALGQGPFFPEPERLVSRPFTPAQQVLSFLDQARELVPAALELSIGQGPFAATRIEPISTTAGRLLVEAGAARTLDEGIVQFHESLAKQRPSLGRILRISDRRAGRQRFLRRLNPFQQAVQKGLISRDKKGALTKLNAADKKRIRASKGLSERSKRILIGKKKR